MTAFRPIPQVAWLDPSAYRQKLLKVVVAALPRQIQIAGVNFSTSTASSYWLLKKHTSKSVSWLTLRIANHPLWLQGADQLEILWLPATNFQGLGTLIQQQLAKTPYWFQLSTVDRALLVMLLKMERQQLTWFVRLPDHIATQHKGASLDLKTNFQRLPLFIGNRNNVNTFLKPMSSVLLQQKLATMYGQNLLFSQFKAHHLLALLPTNQWLQPVLATVSVPLHWQRVLRSALGHAFWQAYQAALAPQ